MKSTFRFVGCGAAAIGALVTLVGGLRLDLGVPVAVARGLVVGLVVYMAMAMLARLGGWAFPRAARRTGAAGENRGEIVR